MRRLLLILLLLFLVMRTRTQSLLEVLRTRNRVSVNVVEEPFGDTYDFVIVGSGSGGAVVANRLSENPDWRVLLLEAGGPEGFLNQIPMMVNLFQPSESNSWGYLTEPQERACLAMRGQRCRWPMGKALGGSSTMNYMIHSRGNRVDYDVWEARGNVGWSYKDVLPYFKKSEKFNMPDLRNSSYHGTKGHVSVEYVNRHTNLSTSFIRAGQDIGFKVIDYNGVDQIGFSFVQVNTDRGRRCSAASAYLTNRRANLHILTGAHVTKILIRNRQAYGVKYLRNGRKHVIRASKEVILSAGTINSAQLLMLSGIGPKEDLEKLGVKHIQEAHTGNNLLEHASFFGMVFFVNQSVSLLPPQQSSTNVLINYLLRGDGLLTMPGGFEALAFVKSHRAPDSRPDVELLFVSAPLHSDRGISLKSSLGISQEVYDSYFRPIENMDAWSVYPIVQSPRSVGKMTLRSKDPFDPPIIQPNLFADPRDLDLVLEGLKYAIEIAEMDEFQRYGTRLYDKKVPGCVELEFGSDDYWRCAIQHLTLSMNHQVGTCKMGSSSDSTSVVDEQLRVHGIKQLRVVDASVMPTLPTGHPNAVVYMIGEKASDMIKQTWKDKED